MIERQICYKQRHGEADSGEQRTARELPPCKIHGPYRNAGAYGEPTERQNSDGFTHHESDEYGGGE